MTCHYVNDFKHKTVKLGVLDLNDNHNSVNIEKWLLDLTEFWHIRKESIVTVVTDNAKNIVKAVESGFGSENQF